MNIPITMTSDFICPWCLIGDARLQRAIDLLPDDITVTRQWLPFELNPDMPVEGMDRKVYRSAKFGSWDHSLELDRQTVRAGDEAGVAFDYSAMDRTPNTFAAHRLSWFAARHGKQDEAVPRILKAYFSEGRDIGDLSVLSDIGAESGLERDAVAAFLESDEGSGEVRGQIADAARRGVRGVPHFDLGSAAVFGAQRPEAIRDAILNVAEDVRVADGSGNGGIHIPLHAQAGE